MASGESELPGEETQLGSPLMLEGGAVVGSLDLENKRTVGKRETEREKAMLFKPLIFTSCSGWHRCIHEQGPSFQDVELSTAIGGSSLHVLGAAEGGDLQVLSLCGSQGWVSELSVGGDPTTHPRSHPSLPGGQGTGLCCSMDERQEPVSLRH